MERILRGEPGWQEAIVAALRSVPRPIAVDPRVLPRRVASDPAGVPAGSPATTSTPAPPAYDRSTFPPAREAATLLLLYPGPDGELSIPLTVRRPDLRDHAGEVSLPGGAVDAGDDSVEAAALREAWEEVGVEPAAVRILGVLDEVWIPVTNFQLRPFVGAVTARPELVPHVGEVAAIVELPARLLLADDAIAEQEISGPDWTLRAGAYLHDEQVIWGATARTLAMFATVLRRAGEAPRPRG